MRFLFWNLLFSTWLLLSAFALPQTPLSSALTAITAFAVLLFAFLAAGRPALRFVITALALVLGMTAVFLPGGSLATAVSNGVVGALLFALSLVRPTHAAATERDAAQPAKP